VFVHGPRLINNEHAEMDRTKPSRESMLTNPGKNRKQKRSCSWPAGFATGEPALTLGKGWA